MLKTENFFIPTDEEIEKSGFSLLDAEEAEKKEEEWRKKPFLGLGFLEKILAQKKADTLSAKK